VLDKEVKIQTMKKSQPPAKPPKSLPILPLKKPKPMMPKFNQSPNQQKSSVTKGQASPSGGNANGFKKTSSPQSSNVPQIPRQGPAALDHSIGGKGIAGGIRPPFVGSRGRGSCPSIGRGTGVVNKSSLSSGSQGRGATASQGRGGGIAAAEGVMRSDQHQKSLKPPIATKGNAVQNRAA